MLEISYLEVIDKNLRVTEIYTQVPSKCDVLGDLIFLLELRLKASNSQHYCEFLNAIQAKKAIA